MYIDEGTNKPFKIKSKLKIKDKTFFLAHFFEENLNKLFKYEIDHKYVIETFSSAHVTKYS